MDGAAAAIEFEDVQEKGGIEGLESWVTDSATGTKRAIIDVQVVMLNARID
jgi:hypothetical protein